MYVYMYSKGTVSSLLYNAGLHLGGGGGGWREAFAPPRGAPVPPPPPRLL